MLKLLLDENIGHRVEVILGEWGYDVKSVLTERSGLTDIAVLEWAHKERRIVVTLDRDFGRLVFLNSQRHVGVIFLRLVNESIDSITSVLERVLKQYGQKLENKFTTVSETNVRMR